MQDTIIKLYTDGLYEKGIDELLKVKESLSAASFHYNLGTLYAKLGKFEIARFHLEKALKSGGVDLKVLNNLDYVVSQLNLADITNSPNFLDRLLNWFLLIPADFYVVFFALVAIMLVVLMRKQMPRVKIMVSSVSLLIGFALSFYHSTYRVAVVLESFQTREGPSEVFNSTGEIPAGAKLVLGQGDNGWYLVKRPSTYRGWIQKDKIGFL